MNVFRILADMLHLLSFIVIVYKLLKHRNCRGSVITKHRCICENSRDLPNCIPY